MLLSEIKLVETDRRVLQTSLGALGHGFQMKRASVRNEQIPPEFRKLIETAVVVNKEHTVTSPALSDDELKKMFEGEGELKKAAEAMIDCQDIAVDLQQEFGAKIVKLPALINFAKNNGQQPKRYIENLISFTNGANNRIANLGDVKKIQANIFAKGQVKLVEAMMSVSTAESWADNAAQFLIDATSTKTPMSEDDAVTVVQATFVIIGMVIRNCVAISTQLENLIKAAAGGKP